MPFELDLRQVALVRKERYDGNGEILTRILARRNWQLRRARSTPRLFFLLNSKAVSIFLYLTKLRTERLIRIALL